MTKDLINQSDSHKPSNYELKDIRKLSIIYATYRIAICLIMAFLFFGTINNPIIGRNEPLFFAIIIIFYFCTSVTFLIAQLRVSKFTNLQRLIGFIIDILVLTLMLFANGGSSIQVTLHFIVCVVAAFIILRTKQAVIITLLAIICVVYQQFYFIWVEDTYLQSFSTITLLALSFVSTGFFSNVITARLKETEVVAHQQSEEVKKLNSLNKQIIESTHNGILVINQDYHIALINDAARDIFELKYKKPDLSLTDIDKSLANMIISAIEGHKKSLIFQPNSTSKVSEAIAIQLYDASDKQTILFIEKVSKSQQQAQQMKLASLGRLTASIAHEIRNPIGAISQASQLLNEENDENQALYQIIHKQTQRVNQIIEDVLQLSRQSSKEMSQISIAQFLHQLLNDHFDRQPIELKVKPDIILKFNQSQLEQVLLNLIENGLNHGKSNTHELKLKLIASSSQHKVFIDVIDNGPGVSVANQQKLFEPFFTTAKTGTGLGLYLSKAFCEANGASLEYIMTPNGSCFRISQNR